MIKTDKHSFEQKISLIYEYNKRSPLFARKASIEIENNNVESAIEILKNSFKEFPTYPVPFFILGKAYALLGKYLEAEESFRRGSELIQSPETFQHYLNEIENFKRNRLAFAMNTRAGLKEDEVRPAIIPQLQIEEPQHDNQLEELAQRLSSAKIKRPSESDQDFRINLPDVPAADEINIASDTLASIYESQNQFDEAIKVYEKLIQKNPSKSDEYIMKIKVLSEKIS